MKAIAPGHQALAILSELVSLVADRMTYRMFVESNNSLNDLMERAETVTRRAARGVPRYTLEDPERSFCELCGGCHEQLVEVCS